FRAGGRRGAGAGLGARGGFFFRGPYHLLDLDGKRAALHRADQREREERQAWHRFAIQRGKEAVQAMGLLAGFGYDRFITAEQIDISSLKDTVGKLTRDTGRNAPVEPDHAYGCPESDGPREPVC